MNEVEVLATNERFYRVFAERDHAGMEALWATTCPVVCIHPGWPPIRGRKEILASWQRIFEHDDAPRIRCEGPTTSIVHESATVVCRERLGRAVLVATNVFVLERGLWRMAHHHASALARVPETPPIDPEFLPN